MNSAKFLLKFLSLSLLTTYAVALYAQGEQKLTADEEQKQSEKPASSIITLESTFIGDKEQPSVSYFIPWKGNDSPDDLKWNVERKNDDTLGRVDRDIMLRSINIYDEMKLEN